MRTHYRLLAALIATLWFSACGAPRAPLPPSLELARPVTDLTATRKGNKVSLSWTAPTQTTDGQNIRRKRVGPAQICRAIAVSSMSECVQEAGQVPAADVPVVRSGDNAAHRMAFTDTLNEQVQREHATDVATYGVAMLNWHGRSSGLSNLVQVPLAPTAATPANVKAEVIAEGVRLAFTCSVTVNNSSDLKHFYRVYRRTEGATNAVPLLQFSSDRKSGANSMTATFDTQCVPVDKLIEWEQTYYYHVTPITVVMHDGKKTAEVEGDDSPEIKVLVHDVFPPAQASGIQAVFSGPGQKPFIDLTWAPNTDADLAGYNVYRHEQGQAPAKINADLVKTPSYRDDAVQSGHAYSYAVSAVDLRGNEGATSEETSERVP